ncbi:MAG: hypothetical protein DRI39_04970 [Chloroflexi bacterium]|nr:MAG: hypothetical protein DRI39_04970 [Chloroflexota bacterium]
MSRRGCSVVLLVMAALFLVGLAGGAIGRALDIGPIEILKVPVLEIHEFFRGDPIFDVGPFTISNTLIASWLTVILVIAFAFAATRKMRLIPGRLQGLVEVALETLLNFVEGVAGKRDGRRFFPIIATIFIVVIFNAYFALLPFFGPGIYVTEQEEVHASTSGVIVELVEEEKVEDGSVIARLEDGEEITAPMSGHVHLEVEPGESITAGQPVASITSQPPLFRSANTDINMTLALALVAVVSIELWGLMSRGFRHYISEYISFGQLARGIKLLFTRGRASAAPLALLTGVINVIMGMLEAVSHMTRIISFAFRLFGNMTAGEILLLSATFLVPWIMAIPFYGLELLIGFIQALIFGGLTLVWASMAVAHATED